MTWYAHIMATIEREELPQICFEPSALLGKVPAIPNGSLPERVGSLKKSVFDEQLIGVGHSNWEITGRTNCGLGGRERKTGDCPIILGVRESTPIRFHANPDRPRRGVISAITAGLGYILSKRLVELQSHDNDDISSPPGNVYYTNKVAAVCLEGSPRPATPCPSVFIGDVDDETCRWWQALLATGQGWKAEIAVDNGGAFLPPWAVQIKDGFTCQVKCDRGTSKEPDFSPPSSLRAMMFLRNFCELHNVTTEFSIALVTALMLPVHNFYGIPVNLQWQLIDDACFPRVYRHDDQLEIFWSNIQRYLSLCGHPRGIMSNLCGGFWEPDIPCNLVHAWLYPPFEHLPTVEGISGSMQRHHEALLRVCVGRRPKLAPLFLGANLSGVMSLVLRFVKSGIPVLDLDAAGWARCEQCFIQNSGQQTYIQTNSMSRTDVWRLLYITEEYPSPPLTPWKPFGEMELQNIPLQASTHRGCSDHYLRYQLWRWELADGSFLEDEGLHQDDLEVSPIIYGKDRPTSIPLKLPPIQDTASENATRHAFQWVTVNGDGFPPSERDIYNHEWVGAGDDFSDYSTADCSESGDDERTKCIPSSLQTTREWLMQL
ncbi:hypothetical protein BO78DRAFT_382624 [Aspergillus sclerotiicarbonarius CBS 121057]|uniref:Uncharacterized protein n=1 Tax=Aspergillus sclerotiicarbonarius (strain CBS 121057 / IBT 28362) TaxID=1448318 RepID=A0A319F0Z2_ASPSB|nr:hypothetical protein BO78DRAFT_382624 [Aspergillus sclerotiicarbonarius CBS 121057]